MALGSDFKVAAGKKLDLAAVKTSENGGYSKEEGKAQTAKNLAKIVELQAKLYAEHKQSLLIVLQAMDAGGKDGAIETLTTSMNAQGLRVVSFKVPSKDELDHDYLWRIHKETPAKGDIAIFNRSHYEDVLVVRVNGYAPEEVWKKRYGQINAFEKLLAENGTRIVKFMLHISKDEQYERLKARVVEPDKNWKFSEGDMKEREKWDDYQAAFADAVSKCSTAHAPWYVVPSDKKWFRDLVISDVVLKTLESMDIQTPKPTFDRQEMLDKYFGGMPEAVAPKAAVAPAKKK